MIVFAGHDRRYTLPAALRTEEQQHASGWEILSLAQKGNAWAEGVIASMKMPVLEEGTYLAVPDPDDEDILRELLRDTGDGYETYDPESHSWVPTHMDGRLAVDLDAEVASALFDAQQTGAGLVLRYSEPLAWLPPTNDTLAIPLSAAVESAEEGVWKYYAVVDDLDHGAVLNLIRMAPGPIVESYTETGWQEDSAMLADLRGVTPPLLVEVEGQQLSEISAQIDTFYETNPAPDEEGEDDPVAAAGPSAAVREKAADEGEALPDGSFPIRNKADLGKAVQAFGRAKDKDRAKRHIIKRARALNAVDMLPEAWGITAAGFPKNQKCKYCKNPATQRIIHSEGLAYVPVCDDHLEKGKEDAAASVPFGKPDEDNIDRIEPVTAASALSPLPGVSPDPRAEKLRRYWSIGGKGGLKIKWGLPGDWKRCVRHLTKYMGPRAKGYCQLLHKRNTGVYTGSKLNASVTPIEPVLLAAIGSRMWLNESDGKATDMRDGVYTEVRDTEAALMEALVAGGFPVAPPDEWFEDPKLEGPTPLTVDDNGRVRGHIATFDIAHIGMPGNVRAPKSKSGYAYFHTGDLVTASGKHISVGQLTLAGGHAPLHADAGSAVKHYDDTASGAADIRVGEDRFGIWAAGAVRPEVTPEQLRTLRASAPSGDWRPINGSLELVAICQVNVPGFPVARARVASGMVTALVAAGAAPLAEAKAALLANEALAQRVLALEAMVASGAMVSAGEVIGEAPYEPLAETEEGVTVKVETESEAKTEEEALKPEVNEKIEKARQRNRDRKRQALRDRVHKRTPSETATAAPVAASGDDADPKA